MSQINRSEKVTFVISEQFGDNAQEMQVVGERRPCGSCTLTVHIAPDGWMLDLDEVDLFVESLADTLQQVVQALHVVEREVSPL